MRFRTNLAFAGALAVAVGTPVFAGDLAPPPLPAIPMPAPQQTCCGSEPGWYLRGDVGASLNEVGHHKITASPALTNTTLRGYNDDLTASALVGVGVGYAVN